MKNIRVFLSENFQFLEVKFSIYLNRSVFVMLSACQLGPYYHSRVCIYLKLQIKYYLFLSNVNVKC